MAKRIQIESWSATARTLHWLMALLILLQAIGGWVVEEMDSLPLSGWLSASTSIIPWKLWWLMPWPRIASPGEDLHEIAEAVHEGLIWALAAVLAVHVSAALYHHFVKRDAVLRRMLRGNP